MCVLGRDAFETYNIASSTEILHQEFNLSLFIYPYKTDLNQYALLTLGHTLVQLLLLGRH